MKIYKKVLNVQANLKASKNQKNEYGGYKYRSCEDIIEAVKPLLKEEELILNIVDDVKLIGDRYYIEATATLIDCETGETISAKAYAREDLTKKGMDVAQITGSVSSYARKYALNGLLAIDDTKDSDATNTHNQETKAPSTRNTVSDKQINYLLFLNSKAGFTENKLKTTIKNDYNLDDLNDLNTKQLNILIEKLNKIINK